MKRTKLSTMTAKSCCVPLLFALLISSKAYPKELQSGAVYLGSTTTGAIVVADFNKDGHPDILTVDSGTGTSNFILMGQANGTFVSKLSFAAGGNLSAVVAGDFNGDGILDIAVTDSNLNNVIVLLGVGDGTFTTKATFAVGASPVAIVAADLNGDGKLDLLVASNPAGTVTPYLGVGDGTFTAQASQDAGALDPVALTTGDFNGDGKLDVAVALNSNRMSILGGNGDGTLQAPLTSIILNEVNPSDIKTVDFNGDGKLDLIVCTLGSVLFIPGNGNLSFGTPVRLATLPGQRVTIADLDGDGHPDIVVARNSAVTVLVNNGTGGVASSQTYHGAGNPKAVAVADFNGDGKLDVAVGASLNGAIHVFSGNGDGTLRAPLNYDYQSGGCGGSGEGLVAADFNHDGRPDIAVADACNRVTVLLNNGDFKFTVVLPVNSLAVTQFRITSADMNGDGNPDIVAIGNDSISVLLGVGDGTFKAPVVTSISASSFHHVIAGDFNGDGKLDLAYTQTNPPDASDTTVGILLGNGDGTFQPLSTVLSAGELPNGLAVGDFNGDGKLDLAVLNGGNGLTSTVNIFLGSGTGTFIAGATLSTGAFPIDIRAVDFNNDGRLDLVVANSGNGTPGSEQAFTGQGNGAFIATSNLPAASPIGSMAIGDFDGDGFPDIALGADSGEVYFFRHNVAGVFDPPVILAFGDSSSFLAAADLNGGGVPDLVALLDGTVAVMPNTGGLKVTPLTSSLNPSLFGQSITFTTRLIPSFPGHLPAASGNIQFNEGTALLASAAPDPSGTATFATATLNSGTHAVSASYPGDSNYIPRSFPALSQLVNKAGTSTSVTSSVVAAVLGDAITFSSLATSATSGIPTGTMSLLDGTISIATLPLNASGAASFSQSNLTAGSHSLKASYSGDQHYLASTSDVFAETVFTNPDFQISTSTPSPNVRAGQSATIPLNLVAARFAGPVTFSCSGLPSLASCSFSSSTLALGTGNFSTVLTVTTTASSVAALQPIHASKMRLYLAALVFPGFAGLVLCSGPRLRAFAKLTVIAMLVLGLVFLSSCAGGGAPPKTVVPGTPVGTSSVVVQATGSGAGGTSHQLTVTLTVTP